MAIALWIVQVLLALFFVMAGNQHGIKPIADAAVSSPWITSIPVWLARFIGLSELLGAVGLIVPAATRIKPVLTPIAAVGLAIIMGLAIPFHIMRGEASFTPMHFVVVALCIFVAWGRFKKAPIAPR